MRRFERVLKEMRQIPDVETKLPTRSDPRSGGYDFYAKETKDIEPGEFEFFWSDVKALMNNDEVLVMQTRSGNGINKGLILRNCTGIIDSSYYSNTTNDGNIGVCLVNTGDTVVHIKIGDRIAQGLFMKYLVTDDDAAEGERNGGFGSTGN